MISLKNTIEEKSFSRVKRFRNSGILIVIFALKKSQQKIRGFVIVLWIIQLGYAKIVLMISVKSLILNCNRLAIIND